jgi:hypothetical protein
VSQIGGDRLRSSKYTRKVHNDNSYAGLQAKLDTCPMHQPNIINHV